MDTSGGDERPSLRREFAYLTHRTVVLAAKGASATPEELLEHQRFKVQVFQRIVAEGAGEDDAATELAAAVARLREMEGER